MNARVDLSQIFDLPAEEQKRDNFLLWQGTPGDKVLLLESGIAKVIHGGHDGTMTWLAFRGPGDLLGEMSVLQGSRRSASVIAASPCKVISCDSRKFLRMVKDQCLWQEIIQGAIKRCAESDQLRGELQTLRPSARLARTLLRLRKMTTSTAGDVTGLSQTDIAQAIGVHRTRVGVILARWRREGIVETSTRRIAITDPKQLCQYAKKSC